MGCQLHLPSIGDIHFTKNPTILELAQQVFPKKIHQVVGAFINHQKEISDLRTLLKEKDHVQLVFIPSQEALEVIRHSAAHVMAQAVQELWPDIKVTIGPVIENGFYYDFDSPITFLPEHLDQIEKKMQKIIDQQLEITKEVWKKAEAISIFKKISEPYKVEIIEELNESEVSIYRQNGWFDLCRGPHVKNLSQIGAIKILSQSGAYWRGDEKRQQLQRIYGTAFHSEKELQKHLKNKEEATRRDHRKLGKEMNLFHFSDLSPGNPFFTKQGTIIYNELKKLLQSLYIKYNYEEVISPQIFNEELFDRSGHKEHFINNMYPVSVEMVKPILEKKSETADFAGTKNNNETKNPQGFLPKKQGMIKEFFLKPMNCPGHCLLYSFHRHSYKNLPWRISDFGRLHRKEKRGTLHGLTRVNSFCQDDAHVFCTQEQLQTEIENILNMLQEVYGILGLENYHIALSTRPDSFMGEKSLWDQAEQALSSVLEKLHIPFEIQEGEGAFYGPKLDFMFIDNMNRSWQLSTLQCDFNMPRAFNLKYVDHDNTEKHPILLHRAVLGSLERFIGVYLEHTGGHLPLWLAPVQMLLINISREQEEYIHQLKAQLKIQNFRVEIDLRGEKLSYKIRAGRLRRIPCIIVIGEKEVKTNTLSIRLKDGKTFSMNKDSFIKKSKTAIQSKNIHWMSDLKNTNEQPTHKNKEVSYSQV